ncbi:MAG: methyltransferase [Deltaproteobacteria bacterium]|nr:methyltransferase [Deltaproteobacteria bacterium]
MAEPSSNARKHASRNPLQRALIGHFTRVLVREVAALRPRRVLEIGCGEGHMLAAIADAGLGAELIGVELSATAVTHARARLGSRARIEQGDALALADDHAADVVLMLEVLEHLADPSAMLPVLARLCRPYLVASVPWEPMFRLANLARGHHLRRLGNHPEHLQAWSRRGFLEFIGQRFELRGAPLVPPWTMVVARARADE